MKTALRSQEQQEVFAVGNNSVALGLFGRQDENLKLIAEAFAVDLIPRGNEVIVRGDADSVKSVVQLLSDLSDIVRGKDYLTSQEVRYAINVAQKAAGAETVAGVSRLGEDVIQITARGKKIAPKTFGQKRYIDAIRNHGIVFCIGPAGTGKTYLAMAMAIAALKSRAVGRIVLARPAVEAGEKLGFLPGDLQDKVDPYLRPLYDALYDILGTEVFHRYMEKGVIEVAPLAYMRGRTLDDSFVILDEAQNATSEQMKMFLTRLGFGSQAVVTGDITQVDLPDGRYSGLIEVQDILQDIKGISFVYLSDKDVVRHELVQSVIKAYEEYEKKHKNKKREDVGVEA